MAELQAQAMLLPCEVKQHWWYDPFDHTFSLDDSDGLGSRFLDADTLEPVYVVDFSGPHTLRTNRVKNGEIGAADYGQINADRR